MKFLCDRCKTRYSIGDDRVRGKILKIRCKNCANVITVREGMTDADAAEAAGSRRSAKPTTMSPPIAESAPNGAPAGALGAAFASAMTRPPPALEEEWYVSNDGDQEGPYSLADAQRWISGKPFDADLHCWSEGFDDWLAVDKVSHFRGLRKKPGAPPPLPRATGAVPALRAPTRPISTPPPQPIDDEPRPLFAATMASLEKGAAASAGSASAGLGLPSPQAARPSPTPSRYPSPIRGTSAIPSVQARANGSASGAAKALAVTPDPAPFKPTKSGPVPRLETRRGLGGTFDGVDQATQIEALPFDSEAQTAAEPIASQARRASAPASALPVPTAAASPAPASITPRLANAPVTDASEGDQDDELAIGEVSRVVNLADLMRPAKKPAPAARRTPSNAALARTGAIAKLGNTGPVPRQPSDDPNLAPNGISSDPSAVPGTEMAMAPAPAEHSHKRGMIILLGVSVLLLAGVIVAVVVIAGDDTIDKGLGRTDQIDTVRPDDPLRPRLLGEKAGSAAVATNPFFPTRPPIKRPNTGNPTNLTNGSNGLTPELPGGDSLTPEDIDTVSKKYSSGTQRCYMRSQKGVEAINVGVVKSIQATLTVAKDGAVTEVALGSHATDSFGKCLSTAIRGWKFRASTGGRYKITLAFVAE